MVALEVSYLDRTGWGCLFDLAAVSVAILAVAMGIRVGVTWDWTLAWIVLGLMADWAVHRWLERFRCDSCGATGTRKELDARRGGH
ncbi:MAG: hypothetical protein JSR18_10145 [Proteobacteria bacterium]|nr:hypothetical protein [Pseudomonadota bacterium]